jgi:hypothetical protein
MRSKPPRKRRDARERRAAAAASADLLGAAPEEEPASAAHAPLPRETESGCIEYKRQLLSPSPFRLQQLISQLKWRLAEGDGRCMVRALALKNACACVRAARL